MSGNPRPSGRVVVTGIGAVTPHGTGMDKAWARIVAGENAIGPITRFDCVDFTTRIGGEIPDFNAEDFLDKKDARKVDPFIAYAVASSTLALNDSGIELNDDLRDNIGVMVSSGIGGLQYMQDQYRRMLEGGPGKVSPFTVPFMIPDMASGFTSIVHGLKGPNTCVVTACATGANSIGDAYHVVKRGDAVAMLAGGSEAPINPFSLASFCAARALSTNNDDPVHACKPFDLNRDGFVMSEGATVLMLEDYDFAKARGAKIYGEVIGYGSTGDAYHITQPDPTGGGACRALKMALRTAGIKPEDVDYINAHGTSTAFNDKFETMAIKAAFGEQAYKVPVSSTKSMTGHMLGAAGAMEAAISLKAICDGVIPPTINYETPDPECDLDIVPNKARKADLNVVMSNSFGFGGHNAVLVFKKAS